jgi:hypothetical protein
MNDNTIAACSSRTDGAMLRKWFTCNSPFVLKGHGTKMTRGFQQRTNNTNGQFCSNFCNSYSMVFQRHCLSMLHVLLICECECVSKCVCTNDIASATE